MNAAAIIGLISNILMLLGLGVLYDHLILSRQHCHRLCWQLVSGILLGAMGVTLIQNSIKVSDGIIFDTRSVLLSLTGLYFGTVPTIIAALITAAFRLHLGQSGVWAGICIIFASGGMGLAWRHLRRAKIQSLRFYELYLFGIAVHLVVLMLFLTLPRAQVWWTVKYLFTPMILFFPLCTALLGLFLAGRMEHKQSVDELALREERYRSLFEDYHGIILLIEPASGKIIDANPTACRFYGYRREELCNRSMTQINTMDEATVKAQMELASTMRKNCFQFKHKLADGSIRDVEVLSGPISMNGRMLLYSIIFDITERNRTEIRLRESEARFRNLVEVVPVPIYIQCDRRFVYLNPAALKNLGAQSPEQLLNQAILERFPPSLQPLIEERMRILNEQRQEVPLIEETMIKLDGTTFPAEVSAVPFQYEGQDGALVFFRDITERQRLNEERLNMERQILQTQKLESLGVLAGGIAHDFNNILMAVLGHADLALHQLPPFSPVRSNLQEIENASHRAADLCRQMLAYSGKGRFIIETFNLRDLIEEMVHLLQTSISKKAILNLNLEKNLPPMHGDATQIRQIIMNLVINASEAIGDRSGVITISTGAMLCSDEYLAGTYLTGELPHGLYVWLEVSDTGCGMDAATQNRIFEPFFTTKFTGRGLGMAAVMGIVRGHQGALKVYSEVNRGTTFKVLFPAVETDSQPGAGEGESQVQWQGSGTVLLADDEETIRALGTKMLERLGFKTLLAADGCEAVELYTRHRDAIKLVLLDLTMPHMSGDEAFRELRQIDPDVCVILSSGYTENEIASRFAGKGISGFIQKPYNLSTLQTRLREALANQPCSLSEEATGQVTPVD